MVVESSFRTDTTHYTVEQIIEKQNKFIKLLEEIDSKLYDIQSTLFDKDLDKFKEELLQDLSEWKN